MALANIRETEWINSEVTKCCLSTCIWKCVCVVTFLVASSSKGQPDRYPEEHIGNTQPSSVWSLAVQVYRGCCQHPCPHSPTTFWGQRHQDLSHSNKTSHHKAQQTLIHQDYVHTSSIHQDCWPKKEKFNKGEEGKLRQITWHMCQGESDPVTPHICLSESDCDPPHRGRRESTAHPGYYLCALLLSGRQYRSVKSESTGYQTSEWLSLPPTLLDSSVVVW